MSSLVSTVPSKSPSFVSTTNPFEPSIAIDHTVVPTSYMDPTESPTLKPSFYPTRKPTTLPTSNETDSNGIIDLDTNDSSSGSDNNSNTNSLIIVLVSAFMSIIICLASIGIIFCIKYQKQRRLMLQNSQEKLNVHVTTLDSNNDVIAMTSIGLHAFQSPISVASKIQIMITSTMLNLILVMMCNTSASACNSNSYVLI